MKRCSSLSLVCAATFLVSGTALTFGADTFAPLIPKVWDDGGITSVDLPLADARRSPQHVSADYYYRIPVRPIFRSYPVYHPDREPAGYYESLLQREPEILWKDGTRRPKLETEADWIQAGELVFGVPVNTDGNEHNYLRDRDWYRRTGTLTASDGQIPFYSYVVRVKGKVEIGLNSCAMCHTRVLPDGDVIKGAQGNVAFHQAGADAIRNDAGLSVRRQGAAHMLYRTPWLRPDPAEETAALSDEQRAAVSDAIPPGVLARHGLRITLPVQVPDLIGIETRRYLDRTGLQRHRDIGDLMRYGALNQGADLLASYGGWVPLSEMMGGRPLPEDPADLPGVAARYRYSDEQLYALARYLYSLKPPPNPNPFDKRAARGKEIFAVEGCAKCHDPEQGYTNNKLIAAPGYQIPADHPERANIMNRRIGTDATMTLTTRRGTGFYKVPSLLGLWYRGPFEHNGSVATLEDWFDPRRLDDIYVPTGWKGPPGTKTRAVQGHEYGLDLNTEERTALIAFLRTL
jgi:hypothetical protein